MSIELHEAVLSQRATRGPDLYYASAMPAAEDTKAILGIIPGYADHGARYRHVMGALAEHGIGSIAIDLRGHGRALGSRGFCERFDEFLDDARELRTLVDDRAKKTKAPAFLFGHSFGGLTAASSIIENAGSFKGLVLSAPFFGLALEVPKIKRLAGRVASRLYPKLGLPSGLHGKDLTHDAERAKAYDEDPLVFPNATARWFTETVKAQTRAFENASRLMMPLYMAFGTADPVVSFKAGKRFFDAAGSTDKAFEPREGQFHEILNEPSWKELVESISKWIVQHAT
jgi:alpha-beta hydrolase superfamily lysophospholipase